MTPWRRILGGSLELWVVGGLRVEVEVVTFRSPVAQAGGIIPFREQQRLRKSFAVCVKPPFKVASIAAAEYRSARAFRGPRLYRPSLGDADPPGRVRSRPPGVTAICLRGLDPRSENGNARVCEERMRKQEGKNQLQLFLSFLFLMQVLMFSEGENSIRE